MTDPRNTPKFAAFAFVALAIDAFVRWDARSEDAPLPRIPPLADATEIRLIQGDRTLELAREAGEWRVLGPAGGPVDAARVAGLLRPLAEGVPMELRVDEGHFKDYGLESPEAVRAEIAGEDGVIADFYVGSDAPGGASHVRFPDDGAVYRARVGGKAAWARPAGEWLMRSPHEGGQGRDDRNP